jgi:hypothetical protein
MPFDYVPFSFRGRFDPLPLNHLLDRRQGIQLGPARNVIAILDPRKLVSGFQVHPHFRTGAESVCQPLPGFRGDRLSTGNDLIYRLDRTTENERQVGLGPSPCLQFVPNEFPWGNASAGICAFILPLAPLMRSMTPRRRG